VHVSGAFFLPPALACGITRTPLVWQLNDASTPRALAWPLGAIVRLLATRVVVSASAAARHYGVVGVEPAVFYPPVDVAALAVVQPPASRGPRERYRVGLMANWNPDKGVEYFIRAMAHVRRELGDRLEVVFAGGQYDTQTAYCARMEALIDELGARPAVRHLGFVGDVREVLAQLDVLVSSSVAEVFGMSVVEAMAAGIPVVVTSAGGSAEAVHADPMRPAGIIVPSRDPQALADAVVRLWRDPVTAERFGRNGRLVAAKRFDVEGCAAAHWRVYADLAPAALPSFVP
jgi:glycosyltransferase involved in cell wall biosynthesis